MSKRRQAAKVDGNQPEIVRQLRAIPGVTVETGHDDILVGYRSKTHWYELKALDAISKRTGRVKDSELTGAEQMRLLYFTGHYKIVWTLDMILEDMGIKNPAETIDDSRG